MANKVVKVKASKRNGKVVKAHTRVVKPKHSTEFANWNRSTANRNVRWRLDNPTNDEEEKTPLTMGRARQLLKEEGAGMKNPSSTKQKAKK
jgi:hypothetical protein